MTAIAGSIEAVSIDGREFTVLTDAESNRKLGGFENERLMLGNGGAILKKTRVGWMLDGLTLECDDSRDDQEFLQEIADGSDYVACSVTYVSGITYSGKGTIEGEMSYSNSNSAVALGLGGTGKLKKQS